MTPIDRLKRRLIDEFDVKTFHFDRKRQLDMRSGYISGLNAAIELLAEQAKTQEHFEWGDGSMKVGV